MAYDNTVLIFVCYCITYCVFEEPSLTPFEEEELMKKWQEILGPSNEVVVSLRFRFIADIVKNNSDLGHQTKGSESLTDFT